MVMVLIPDQEVEVDLIVLILDQEVVLDQEVEVDLALLVFQVWEVDLAVHLHTHTLMVLILDQEVEVEVEVDQVLHIVTFHTTLL
jgi:hypothetical protein